MYSESIIRNIIVSDNPRFDVALDKIFTPLTEFKFENKLVGSVSEAIKLLDGRSYDCLILNNKDIDTDDLDKIIKISHLPIGIMVMVNEDKFYECLNKCYLHGIITLKRPVTAKLFVEALMLLTRSSERKARFGISNEAKLDEIRHVDVAKGLLISFEKMSEDDAHRYVEKYAMDLRVTKLKSALYIIGKYIDKSRG